MQWIEPNGRQEAEKRTLQQRGYKRLGSRKKKKEEERRCPRLDGLSTAAERDLPTSSTSFTEAGVLSTSTELDLQTSSTKFAESTFAGLALTTVPAYELLGWEYYYETNMCYKV
ncbi:hypothetical protein NECAME_11564 [Necator americanus]|uniref:Uncharacterized protein n=1 Tax=Necator americanus TaxID=51031 RepID=W2T3J2_NECAM|nr:hypothetical protein NECAME_11564 [Necator americanus]ETN76585.1 hypothetical protein NECAME_11564 [Necator americanus]